MGNNRRKKLFTPTFLSVNQKYAVFRGSPSFFLRCGDKVPKCTFALGVITICAFGQAVQADGNPWKLASLMGVAPVADAAVSFHTEGGMSGSTGCNRFFAAVAYEDGAIVVPESLAMTRMACPEEKMQQEKLFTALLQGRVDVGYNPINGMLTLSRGEAIAVFVPAPEDTKSGSE